MRQRFESAWRSADATDSRPRIQDYLLGVPEPQRSAIFCELLVLELKCRQEAGEEPSPQEYYSLFPEAVELIQSVFVETGLAGKGATSSISGWPHGRPHEPRGLENHPTITYHSAEKPTSELTQGRQDVNGGLTRGVVSTQPLNHKEPRPSLTLSGLPVVPGYDILGELGKGGMGVVYKALHLKLQRVVALKMILSSRDHSSGPEQQDRFLAEARAVAQFQHPHLVQIYEIGEHNGQPYFSLELLEGGNLHWKLAGTPQPAAEAAALLETLALAVDYAHQKGFVHRDLKPSNILLTGAGVPKVADFGLAKQLQQDAHRPQRVEIVGTPSYMAPEQAWGRSSAVGPAADTYALGVILYEMLTGRTPFKAADKSETLHLVRTQEPVPPRRLVPRVPRDLELICLKCLKKDPLERFESARELAEELRRFQEGRPILTRPAPLWEQAWKWARRQPALASLIAVSILALFSLMLYLDLRARSARHDLSEQQRSSERRSKVQQLHLEAQEAADRGGLQNARGKLQAIFEILHTEPQLEDLKPPLALLLEEVERKEQVQKGQKDADEAYRRFFKRRDDALLHGSVFAGLDLAVNVPAAKTACEDALKIFGVIPPRSGAVQKDEFGTGSPVFPAYLSAKQRQQCTTACYELLVILAEAESQPKLAGQEPAPAKIKRALQILDRAASLGLPATRAYHLRRGKYLDLQGDEDAARQERKRAQATQAAGALDYFLTGDAHLKQGNWTQAAHDFARALQSEPDHFWARYFLAVCNLQLQKPAQARDNLTACLMTRDHFLSLYLLRGFAHGQLNDFRAAEIDFRQALALQPDTQVRYGILVNQGFLCLRQAQLVEGLAPLPWLLPLTPNLEFACQGVAGAVRKERLAAAAQLLKQAILLQKDQYPAYRYLAVVAQKEKRLDDAVNLLDEAIAAARHSKPLILAQLYGQRGRLKREQEQWEDALDDLDKSLKIFPTAEDHAERGRVLHLLQRYEEAVVAYEEALARRPDQADLYRAKAEVLLTLHRDAEAVAAFDQYAAKGGAASAEILRSRARVHVRLKQFSAALADYTKALAVQPDSPTYNARGWVFLANNAQSLALQDFEAALRGDDANAEAYAGRGLIRVRLGQHAQACADAKAALKHGGPTPPARLLWNVAHVYAQLAGSFASEPGAQNVRLGMTRAYCLEKGVKTLEDALKPLSEAEGAAFWQKYIAKDALLNPLRGSAGFLVLESKYGKKKRSSF